MMGSWPRKLLRTAIVIGVVLCFRPALADEAAIVSTPDNKLNLRDAPDAASNIVTVLSNKTKVHVVGSFPNGWQKIVVDTLGDTGITPNGEMSGFVNSKYLITASVMATQAFRSGRSDRRAWGAWFGGLSGSYHEGAEFWATHRSDASLPACESSDSTFQSGCEEAKIKLADSDRRRLAEPNYKAGWNSAIDVGTTVTTQTLADDPDSEKSSKTEVIRSNLAWAALMLKYPKSISLDCTIDKSQSSPYLSSKLRTRALSFLIDFSEKKVVNIQTGDDTIGETDIPMIISEEVKWEYPSSGDFWALNRSTLDLTFSVAGDRRGVYKCQSSDPLPAAPQPQAGDIKTLACTERGDARYHAKIVIDLASRLVISQQSGVINHGTDMPLRVTDHEISWQDGGYTYVVDRTTLEMRAVMAQIPIFSWDCEIASQKL